MITDLIIKKLFGIFDYDIKMKPGGVTILTGPNGFGKSTILRLIDAFHKGDIFFFTRLDFKEIQCSSNEDQNSMLIRKIGDDLYFDDTYVPIKEWSDEIFKNAYRRQYYYRTGPDSWIDKRNDAAINKEHIILNYLEESNNLQIRDENEEDEDDIGLKGIRDISNRMQSLAGNTRFIREQRLITQKLNPRTERMMFNTTDKIMVNTIEELPIRFKELLNEVSSEYSATANSLDSSYPSRLFSTTIGISNKDYLEKLDSMNEKFEKLNKFDISEMKIINQVTFEDQHAKALKVYFDDFEKKYNVFKEFVFKLELFTKIINSRLRFKEVVISREDGIAVYKNDSIKNKIPLNQLSSGEKQEIVLFYELIFDIEHNVHLLIDEPEISLHIEWQLKFMDDLLEIAKYKGLKVTVATHSPQIINNHWDIQVDLGELYGE